MSSCKFEKKLEKGFNHMFLLVGTFPKNIHVGHFGDMIRKYLNKGRGGMKWRPNIGCQGKRNTKGIGVSPYWSLEMVSIHLEGKGPLEYIRLKVGSWIIL